MEILTNLDPGELSPEWLAEIERRDKRIREGTAVLKDADQVFADAYRRLNAQDRI